MNISDCIKTQNREILNDLIINKSHSVELKHIEFALSQKIYALSLPIILRNYEKTLPNRILFKTIQDNNYYPILMIASRSEPLTSQQLIEIVKTQNTKMFMWAQNLNPFIQTAEDLISYNLTALEKLFELEKQVIEPDDIREIATYQNTLIEKIQNVSPHSLYYDFGQRVPGFLPWIFRNIPEIAKDYFVTAVESKDPELIIAYIDVLKALNVDIPSRFISEQLNPYDIASHNRVIAEDKVASIERKMKRDL